MTCGIIAACAGHVHAYERNYQTYNYNLQGCAPRWITMGGLTCPAAKIFLQWQICTAHVWSTLLSMRLHGVLRNPIRYFVGPDAWER